MDDRNSRTAPLVLLIVLAVIGLAGISGWVKNSTVAAPQTATLSMLQGEATVMRADAGEKQLDRDGAMRVQRGDSVIAGPQSQARLTLGEDCYVTLDGAGELAILDLYRQPLSRNLVVELALDKGEITIRRPKSLLGRIDLTLDTPVASIEMLGSLLGCQVLDSQRIRVIAYEGAARVSMGEREIKLSSGEQVEAVLGQSLEGQASTAATPSALATDEAALVPEPTQSTASTATPPADTSVVSTGQSQTYVVQPGDTLYSIAQRFGLSWDELWEANRDRLASPEQIMVGQELEIPPAP